MIGTDLMVYHDDDDDDDDAILYWRFSLSAPPFYALYKRRSNIRIHDLKI
jgi:hypothetical protein